jgi:23S rRNA (cytosine1962-C5)-methyltransferase
VNPLSDLPQPSKTRLAVRITPDALRHVRAGHPWIYDHSVTSVSGDGKVGDLAVIFDAQRKFAAIGLYDPSSPLRIRVLHHGSPTTIDHAFWRDRLTAAVARRQPLLDRGDTTGMRLVNGEGDSLPGLVLDAYDTTLVIKLYTAAWVPHLADLVAVIDELWHPTSLVLRLARSLDPASLHGLEEGDALIGTAPDAPVAFLENGLAFEADVVRGQKTGHFLDQRDNRAFVAELVRRIGDGCTVLDMFASTGGFTVHAAAAGAARVTAVDLSAPTLAVARRNLDRNAHLPAVRACEVTSVVADAFDDMQARVKRGEKFDIVVVDPPSFAQRQHETGRALGAYRKLTDLAVRLVQPGGWLVQCSCSARVGAEEFHRAVAIAASNARHPLTEWRRTAHPVDHPAAIAESRYLKATFARVD